MRQAFGLTDQILMLLTLKGAFVKQIMPFEGDLLDIRSL
jgi:hypothetical protein